MDVNDVARSGLNRAHTPYTFDHVMVNTSLADPFFWFEIRRVAAAAVSSSLSATVALSTTRLPFLL